MLPTIDIHCPHCGANGQVVAPPSGSVLIGSCPACDGMLAVFCGATLPLDRAILQTGAPEARFDHLMAVLGEHLEATVDQIVAQMVTSGDMLGLDASEDDADLDADLDANEEDDDETDDDELVDLGPITPAEVQRFLNDELPRIDDRNYFQALFS